MQCVKNFEGKGQRGTEIHIGTSQKFLYRCVSEIRALHSFRGNKNVELRK